MSRGRSMPMLSLPRIEQSVKRDRPRLYLGAGHHPLDHGVFQDRGLYGGEAATVLSLIHISEPTRPY